MRRGRRFVSERRLESLDRLEMVAALSRDEAERDPRAHRRDRVAGCGRLVEDRLQLLLRRSEVFGEPELELCVCET